MENRILKKFKMLGNKSVISMKYRVVIKYANSALEIPNMARANEILVILWDRRIELVLNLRRLNRLNLKNSSSIANRISNICSVSQDFETPSRTEATPMEIGTLNFQNRTRNNFNGSE